MTTAVVFAYHNVGFRCLQVLLAQGIDVRLVVTHQDAAGEAIWFESVARLAARHGIETITPADPGDADLATRLQSLAPDFLFSFYYRHMLPVGLLATATRGAFNLHGSLLPRYRGRVPVNWAVIRGETETGASLHEMVAKPDAGRLVDQMAVPILPNDTAHEVFGKVTVAAEVVLARSLPRLVDGTAALLDQDLATGSYFGGRKPADGRIDWSWPARQVHDLVRGVAPPYPGAFASVQGRHLAVLRTWWRGERTNDTGAPALLRRADRLQLRCADGGLLDLLHAEVDDAGLTPGSHSHFFALDEVPLA